MIKFSRTIRLCVAGLLVATVSGTPIMGQSASIEGKIKAAFLYNFIKFVDWPDNAFAGNDAPIRLCVWGHGALDGALDPLNKKTAKKRAIQVSYTQDQNAVAKCHVLFITNVDRQSLQKIIGHTDAKSVLTVGDSTGFAENGGIIGFFRSADRIRFAINLRIARRSGLRISSQLLKLAKIVSSGGQ